MRRSALTLTVLTIGALVAGILGVIPINALGLNTGKQMLLEIAVLALLGIWFQSGWVRAFWWWSVMGYATQYNPLSFLAMTAFLAAMMAYEMLACRFTARLARHVILALRIIASVQMFWMFLQWCGIDPLFMNRGDVPYPVLTGFLLNNSMAGAFLAIVSPLFVSGLWLAALPALIILTALTKSLGAIITLCVCMACAWRFLLRIKKRYIFAVALFVVGTYSATQENIARKLQIEQRYRGAVWAKTIELSASRPVLFVKGWGIGQFKPAFRGIVGNKLTNPPFERVHNDYIQTFFEHGIVGLFFLLGYLVTTFNVLFRLKTKSGRPMRMDKRSCALVCCFIGWLVVAAYWFPARTPSLGILGVVLFGYAENLRRNAIVASRLA